MRAVPLALAMVALPASAAEWSIEPMLRLGGEYNENLLLEAGDPEAAPGANLDVRATFARTTETNELVLAPRVRFLRYDTEVDFDTDDQFVDLWQEFRGERVSTRWSVGFTRDSTLTSELESTGFVDARKRHEQERANASVAFDLSERNQLGLQAHAEDNAYPDAGFSGLVDYRYANAVGWFTRSVSERSQLGVQIAQSDLEVADTGTRTRDRSVQLTLQHFFASHLQIDLFAGVDATESTGASADASASSDGTVYGLTLQRQGALNDWQFSVSQEVVPAGYGELVRRQDLSASLNHRLSESVQLVTALRFLRNEEVDSLGTDRFREYGRADVRIDWHVTQNWLFGIGLAYAAQTFIEGDDSSASSLIGSMTFTYRPQRAAISR